MAFSRTCFQPAGRMAVADVTQLARQDTFCGRRGLRRGPDGGATNQVQTLIHRRRVIATTPSRPARLER
jgi:hypothetical protein